jgi:hypothetical protein
MDHTSPMQGSEEKNSSHVQYNPRYNSPVKKTNVKMMKKI